MTDALTLKFSALSKKEVWTSLPLQTRAAIRAKVAGMDPRAALLLFSDDDEETVASLQAFQEVPEALCTAHEWLNQHMIDSLDNHILESSTVSSSTTTRLYYPQEVQLWESVEEIKNYVIEADNQNRVHEKFSTLSFFKAQGKTEGVVSYIASNVLCQICNFLSKKTGFDIKVDFQVNLSAPNAPEESIALNLATLRKVHAVINCEGNHIVVLELKRIGVLDLNRNSSLLLHEIYMAGISSGKGNGIMEREDIKPAADTRIARCIVQIYEYLILAKARFGILSDTKIWYLVRRDKGCLRISDGFSWTAERPTLLAAISFLVEKGVRNDKIDGNPVKNGEEPNYYNEISSDDSLVSEGGKDKDGGRSRKRKELGDLTRPPSKTRGTTQSEQGQLKEIPEVELHLDSIPMATGWSGNVVRGRINNHPVAVKLAPHGSERAKVLLNEVGMYLELKEHWGSHVPALRAYGTTANGRVVFIASGLIDGVELGIGTVTAEVASAALQALDSVHAAGLLHGDIEAHNFVVASGTQPVVYLLDFGFSCHNTRSNQHKAERMQLQCILEDLM